MFERDGRLVTARWSIAAPQGRPSVVELGAGSYAAVAATPGGFTVVAERRVEGRCSLITCDL